MRSSSVLNLYWDQTFVQDFSLSPSTWTELDLTQCSLVEYDEPNGDHLNDYVHCHATRIGLQRPYGTGTIASVVMTLCHSVHVAINQTLIHCVT